MPNGNDPIGRLVRELSPVASFLLGAYWMNHEVQSPGQRPYFIGAFLVMMGVLPASIIDRWLRSRNGNGNGDKGKGE